MQEGKKYFVHTCGFGDIDELFEQQPDPIRPWICCSTLGCSGYLPRPIAFLLAGEVKEALPSDEWFNGSSWDEVHLAEGFEIVGLFIPVNKQNGSFSVRNTAIAYHYLTYIKDIPGIEVISEAGDEAEVQQVLDEAESFCNLPDEEYEDLWESVGLPVR